MNEDTRRLHTFNQEGKCWCNPKQIFVPEKGKWVHRSNPETPIEDAAEAVRQRILNEPA